MHTYVWDLDGTLIDSYPAILDALEAVLKTNSISLSREEIYQFIIERSVHDFFFEIEKKYFVSEKKLKEDYGYYRMQNQEDVTLMEGAKEMLEALKEEKHFIYTHKGNSTYSILKKLGIASYFTEVITAENGFLRKPEREAMDYLIKKYTLNPKHVSYVGDRPLDMEFAKNSGVEGIFFLPECSPIQQKYGDIVISKLSDLTNGYHK